MESRNQLSASSGLGERGNKGDTGNNRLHRDSKGNEWVGCSPEDMNQKGGNTPSKCEPGCCGRKGRIDDHYSGRQEFLYSQPPPALPQYDQRQQGHFRSNESFRYRGHYVHNPVTFCVDHPYAWDRDGLCRICNRPWQLS